MPSIHYAWLMWSMLLIVIWSVIFVFLNKSSKREMLKLSLWTSLAGFTEPLFVPEYWSPPSLFNLAINTGFDIESLLFAFGVGGIASVIYELIFSIKHQRITYKERHKKRHRWHIWILLSAPIIFLLLLFTDLNPIYSVFISLMSGGFLTWHCRPDLKKKMLVSALMFTGIYFIYFYTLILMYPNYVEDVWNFQALTGFFILNVPLEELMFAFSFGFLWSSIYEHINWLKLKSRP